MLDSLYLCTQNNIMATSAQKKIITFSLRVDLIERLKDMAKQEHCSLDNLVESILFEAAYNEPNEITKAALEEAISGKLRTKPPIDTSSVEAMFKSID